MVSPIPTALSVVVFLGGILFAWASSSALPPTSALCRYGLCGPGTPTVQTEPTNPFSWSDLAEEQAAAGDVAAARKSFAESVRLGPHIPPILIRAVNFAVANQELPSAMGHIRHTLQLTSAYDNILFRYLEQSGLSREQILRDAIPDPGTTAERAAPSGPASRDEHASAPDIALRPAAEPACAWAAYLISRQSSDAEPVIRWLDSRGAISPPLLARWIDTLIDDRKDYAAAVNQWAAAHPSPGYPRANRIYNSRFVLSPAGSRLDWKIKPLPGVAVRIADGLLVTFAGQDNLTYANLTQQTYVPPGRWRFTATVDARDLSTDQRPFFKITDLSDPRRLDITTPMAPERMTADFQAPPGGAWVEITLHRRPSEKFDSKIKGSLLIREVTLEALHGGA